VDILFVLDKLKSVKEPINVSDKDMFVEDVESDEEDEKTPATIRASLPMSFPLNAPIPAIPARNVTQPRKTIADLPPTEYVHVWSDQRYWEKAFPCLFPYGVGGPNDPERLNKLSQAEFDRHCLLLNGPFSTCMEWIFGRFKENCYRSANSVGFKADLFGFKLPTKADLDKTAEYASDGLKRQRLNDECEKLLKKLSSFSGLKNTHYHIQRARREILAMVSSSEMSRPTWFVTLSSADLYWPELWIAIEALNGNVLSLEDAAKLTYQERVNLLDANPVLAARMFKSRVDLMLNEIFRGKAHPIGFLVDWWFRVEFQRNGSLHIHFIIWAWLFAYGKWFESNELHEMMSHKNNEKNKTGNEKEISKVKKRVQMTTLP
jgi:hypothetical protein